MRTALVSILRTALVIAVFALINPRCQPEIHVTTGDISLLSSAQVPLL